MKRFQLTGAAILMCLPSIAIAQTAPAATPMANDKQAAASPATSSDSDDAVTTKMANTPTTDGAGIRQKLTISLQQAGFTNIKIVPDSFIVQAKDKSGDPVTMFLDSNSLAVVASSDPTADNAKSAPGATDQTAMAASDGMFTSIPANDDLSSKMIGLSIYNNERQDIGSIKDIAFGQNGVKAYIVGVGGFLGMGDHYVAVRPSSIKLTYNTDDKKWHAMMDTNADQLKAAPEYKYAS